MQELASPCADDGPRAMDLGNDRPAGAAAAPTQGVLPMLASACPGWVCYAEKTQGAWALPHISSAKSPQAVQGYGTCAEASAAIVCTFEHGHVSQAERVSVLLRERSPTVLRSLMIGGSVIMPCIAGRWSSAGWRRAWAESQAPCTTVP